MLIIVYQSHTDIEKNSFLVLSEAPTFRAAQRSLVLILVNQIRNALNRLKYQ